MKLLALISLLLMGADSHQLVQIPVANHMTLYHLGGRKVPFVVCSDAMAQPLTDALECVAKLTQPVDLVYHGCYNYRYIEGTTRLSRHASGTAIDLNASIGVPMRMVLCFEKNGFEWGGRWSYPTTDPMHFQLREGYRPRQEEIR